MAFRSTIYFDDQMFGGFSLFKIRFARFTIFRHVRLSNVIQRGQMSGRLQNDVSPVATIASVRSSEFVLKGAGKR